jgi:hypothetical protein
LGKKRDKFAPEVPTTKRRTEIDIVQLFVDCDEFCQGTLPKLNAQQSRLSDSKKHRQRESGLTMSKVMTIIILFQSSGFRNFKTYYTGHVCAHLRKEFPGLVSYQRIVELQSQTALPLTAFLQTRFGRCTGISFVDATSIAICHNRRIESNKVFCGLARRGKTSVGWFYGFKVHLVINDSGELLGVMITAGNVDDRKPVPAMTKKLFGKLFGDRGYISQKLFEELYEESVRFRGVMPPPSAAVAGNRDTRRGSIPPNPRLGPLFEPATRDGLHADSIAFAVSWPSACSSPGSQPIRQNLFYERECQEKNLLLTWRPECFLTASPAVLGVSDAMAPRHSLSF